MLTNQMMIAISETRGVLESVTGDIKAKLTVAMRNTYGHWIVTDEDEQFRSAVGAVMMHYGEGSDEFRRLEAEMRQIQKISAMIQAAQAGLSVSPPEIDESFEPIGLLGLWHKAKASR